jgi:hypothetical protein
VIQSQQDFQIDRTSEEEQKIYAHFAAAIQTESPQTIVVYFQNLFIEGVSYQDPQIRKTLEAIVNDNKYTESQFHHFLTHCCYLPIYYWQKQKLAISPIVELVNLFSRATFSVNKAGNYRKLSRIKNWLNSYKTSEGYLKLKRLVKILQYNEDRSQNITQDWEQDIHLNQKNPNLIGNLARRYFYLYEPYLLADNSSNEAKKTIQVLRNNAQKKFELSLAQYMTDKVRIQKTSGLTESNKNEREKLDITLLNRQELDLSLRHFIVEIQDGYSYKSLAKSFLDRAKQTTCIKDFKEDLYQYLSFGIDPKYGKHHFNARLAKTIKEILPEINSQKPNEFFIIRTCSNLLNFLVLDPNQPLNHYLFMDLVTNLGAANTVGIILKLVLICPKIKPSLEKRLSLLVAHYDSLTIDRVPWLVKSLENFSIAFVAHYGKADLSYFNLLD